MQRIQKDKDFLNSCNLMDYSLLLIFFKRQDFKDNEQSVMAKRNVSMFIRRGPDGHDEIAIEDMNDLENLAAY